MGKPKSIICDSEPKYTVRIFNSISSSSSVFMREQMDQYKYGATRNTFTVRGLCIDFPIILSTPCISCVSFFRFRLQKYANAREAVHAIIVAVRLAGITNCHVFVHALRTI